MSDITGKGGNRMTYLVMECHPSYAIVLDNEGRMIKAANLGYQEGQVVGEIIARQTPKAPILFRLAPLAAAGCENVCELYGSRSWSGRCE